jgi:hypothetical protein
MRRGARIGTLAGALALGAVPLLQCDDSPPTSPAAESPGRGNARCEQLQANAQALVDEFARCNPGDACEVFTIGDHLQANRGPCLIPFLCSRPIRSGASTSELLSRAQSMVGEVGSCACAIANCADPQTLEAYCDSATSRCTTRRK